MNSPLQTIRARTLPVHSQLEEKVDLARFLSSPASYRELLERYLEIYRPFETLLAQQPVSTRELVRWQARSKVRDLERDLLAIGSTRLEFERVPRFPGLPSMKDLDCLLGMLYVVEGSALGGQIIYRMIVDRLGFEKDSGAAFFFGDGPHTGERWRSFTTMLDMNVIDADRAATAACEMFAAFEFCLRHQRDTSGQSLEMSVHEI